MSTEFEEIAKTKNKMKDLIFENRKNFAKYERLVQALFSPARYTQAMMIDASEELAKLIKTSAENQKELVLLSHKLLRQYSECPQLLIKGEVAD